VEVEGVLQEAVQRKPHSAYSHYRFGMFLLHDKGMPAEAETELRKAISLKDDNVYAHAYLAEALEWQGRWQEALVVREKVVRLATKQNDPNKVLFQSDLVKLLLTCPDPKVQSARRAAEEAQKAWGIRALMLLGEAQYRAGNWQASIDALEKLTPDLWRGRAP